jgi:hypothetical protein
MGNQVSKPVDVDGVLIGWGASLFGTTPVRRTKQKVGLTGLKLPSWTSSNGSSGAGRPEAKVIRDQLRRVVKRSPEVLVKISGGGKGMRQIKDHLDYISRNGKIELENEDGDVLSNRDDLRALHNEWQMSGGFPIPENGTRREAFNIVLSMPAGTDPAAVRRAARDFAAHEFGSNHRYAMALHTFDTDIDPNPSKHPHVHLCVKARGFDGIRLNPRKADLRRWREEFAGALCEHGIEASATKRQPRFQRQRGEKQSMRQMKLRGKQPTQVELEPERIARVEQLESVAMRSYHQLAKALALSEDANDRKLAVGIVERLGGQRHMQDDHNMARYDIPKPDRAR